MEDGSVNRRELGHSGLMASEFALGAMYYGWAWPKETAVDRLDQYAEAGGNFIDTANAYSEGDSRDEFEARMSERVIGEWMRDRKNRSRMIIASKMGEGSPCAAEGASARQIREECEKSLKRLQTDYIDLYYLHLDDRGTPLEESLGALGDLVGEGKVRHIGASNFNAWRLAVAIETSKRLGLPRFCAIQNEYTYLRIKHGFHPAWPTAEPMTADLLDFARSDGIAVLAYSPLLSGAYARPEKGFPPQYTGGDAQARLAALAEVAGETGATKNQVVYAWLMRRDPPAIPLVASRTAEQFVEAQGALELKLTAAQLERLDGAREE
jgi:aryl-alcohol dehydrogenase-like predicted oxidoreductase